MPEPHKIWPPAPDASLGAGDKPTAATDAMICPNCERKLLTQTSKLCNWCGAVIEDPEYQQKAAEIRQIRDEVERALVEAMVHEEARFGVLGRLKRRARQGGGTGGDLRP